MPIKYVKGDLFGTDIKCIAHGCNTAGVMGSGVAAVVKKKYPETYKTYALECKLYELTGETDKLLGRTHVTKEGDLHIYNMYTQGDFSRAYGVDKRYASYDAISECFDAVNTSIGTYLEDKRLAIPMIGAGLGGGDWDIIERIIEKSCPDIEVTVYQL